MTVDVAEAAVRVVGVIVLLASWAYSGLGAIVGSGRPAGRSSGLASRLHAHGAYALGAVPYFAICVVLWRSIPLTPSIHWRAALLVAGGAVGFVGAGAYLLGRRELGRMYNVSSSLGSELFEDHVLVTTGPYGIVRHPMYVGLLLCAVGGLMVYRTWTLVFMCMALVGAAFKAHAEERLLADEFGADWASYAARVPGWFPHIRRSTQEVTSGNTAAYR